MNHNVQVRDAPESATASAVTYDLSVLVQDAQRGSEQAFRLLYRTVQPGLLRYLQVLVGDDADDVASETWLQIARDLSSFSGDGEGFRGWVATIGRHRAFDHLRAERRRPHESVPTEQLTDVPESEDTATRAIDGVGTAAALALIAQLPRDQAEAVLLRVVMGLDATAAARVLGKRPGAVRTAVYRGLRRLAETLTHQGAAMAYLQPPPSSNPSRGLHRRSAVTQPGPAALKDVT
jgi:RNA polymerase sigma-70 factor (ECF subfamily)